MSTSLRIRSLHTRRTVGLSALALAIKVACGTAAYADLPTGGNVISGAGSIAQSGNTLTVNQQTARMGVEWESFNVGAGQRVQFVQPGADSVALNRVVGSDASQIMGSLDANGKVFLVNPNGVVFGKDAQVNTGGLVASTLDISNEDFAAGNLRFTKGTKAGSVVNAGNLTAGSVVLIAPTIENSGSINTYKGNTTLAAGEAVTVSVMNNGLITAKVDKATLNASIKNSGRIVADGGSISLQAGTADAVLDSLINTEGLLQARSIENRDGKIFLGSGAGGTTIVAGTVDASGYATGQSGGDVTALGKNVGIVDGTTIDASGQTGGGTVLVGGNWQGQGPEMNAKAVVVSNSATIKADAKNNGDGGTVVLWSDEYTNFAGTISARGGATGGNGGMVETSSKDNLQAFGQVDAAAPKGAAGQWLLDPTDIAIVTGAGYGGSFSGSNPLTWTATGSGAEVNNITINNALNAGTSVTISTASGNGSAGDIFVRAPITKTTGGDATLRLSANRDVFVDAGHTISSTSGRLHVVLQSRSADAAEGTAFGRVQVNGTIRTNGGDIKIGGGPNADSYAYASGYQAVNLWASAVLDARGNGGGNISLRGRAVNHRGVEIGANAQVLTDGTGTISMFGDVASGAGFGLLFLDGAVVRAQQGWINAHGIASGGFAGIQFGDVEIRTTSGDLTLTGTNFGGDTGIFKYANGTTATIASNTGLITLTGTVPAGPGAYTTYAPIHIAGGTMNVTTGGKIVINANGGYNRAGLEMNGYGNFSAGTGIDFTHGSNASAYSIYSNNGGSFTTTTGDIRINASRSIYMTGAISVGSNGNISITAPSVRDATISTFDVISSGGSGNIDVRINTDIRFNGAISGGSGDITLASVGDMTFNGMVSGTGVLNLPAYNSTMSIGVGGGAGTTQFAASLFSGGTRRFADGFREIVIGAANGQSVITVGALTATDPLTFLAGWGGSVRFTGSVVSTGNDIIARSRGNITFDAGGTLTGRNLYIASDNGNFVNNRGASALNASGRWLVYANSPTTNTYGGLASGNKAIWNQNFDSLAPGSAPSGNRYIFRFTPAGGTIGGSLSKIYGETTFTQSLSTSAAPYTNTQGGMWIADTAADVGLDSFSLAAAGLTSSGLGANANVGSYTVSLPTAYTSTGYAVTLDPAVRLKVLQRALTVTAQTQNRVYDGTTSSIGPVITSGWLVNGNTGNWVQTFDNKNIGTGKLLTASGTVNDGNGGNNYAITFVNNTGTITRRNITASLVGTAGKVYDGDTNVALAGSNYQLSGVVGTDNVLLNNPTTGTLGNKNVGSGKIVTVGGLTISGADANNYTVNTTANANIGNVTARALTAALIGGTSKVYDGNTSVVLNSSNYQLSGILGTDSVVLSNPSSGTLGNKNVGTGKNVTVSGLSLSGADAGNYTVASSINANIGEVTAKAISALLIGNASKIYDGTTDIALTNANYQLNDVVSGDSVTLNNPALGTLNTKHVGAGKHVTVSGLSLSGGDAGNYVIDTSLSANIGEVTQRALTIAAASDTKVYDQTTDSSRSVDLIGLATGDSVTATQSFDSVNAGNRVLSVDAGYVVDDGNGGNNYVVTTADAAGTIDRRDVFVNVTANDKVYDANTIATGTVTNISGILAGDAVLSDGSATFAFDDKNVGNNKAVTVSGMTLTGADAHNYQVASAVSTDASITPKALTAALIGHTGRVYDGTTDITLDGSNYDLDGVIVGDFVDLNNPTLGALDTKHVGNGKNVTVDGLALLGADSGNYTVNTSANANIADITRRALTIAAVADTKIYDRTTTSAQAVDVTGLASGDSVTATQSFDSRNAGNRTLSVDAGYVVDDGNGGNNYLVTRMDAVGTIDKRDVIVTVNANDKVYDGNTIATGTVTGITNVIAGDQIFSDGTASFTFADKNVGNNKGVAVSGMTLTGADVGNYQIASVGASNASITPKALTASLIGSTSRVYDGTRDIALTSGNYNLSGIVAGDIVDLNNPTLGTLDTKHVGTGKNVVVNGLSISGADASNYTVNNSAGANIAAITQRALTLAAVSDTKVYDRTTTSSGSVDVTGLVGGDTVTATQSFDSRNAGNRTLSVDAGYVVNDGNGGNNYAITTAGAVGTIDRRDVSVFVTANDKVYDGTTVATGTVNISNVIAGDTVVSDGTATYAFADKNVGNNKPVSVSGMTLAGADAMNYQIASVAASNASITPATLIVAAAPKSKIYGSADPSLTYGYSGLQGTDDASVFSGSLTRDAGENVGLYAIHQGTLSAGGNYIIAFGDATLRINPATLTIGAVAGSKVYGDLDPTLGYTVSGLVNGDTSGVITGALSRTAGENVGSYAIHLGSLSAGGNYTIAYTGNAFDITRRTLTVTANDLSRIYGDVDPSLTFSHGALVNGDTDAIFSGSLTRGAGENVGHYAITRGTLSAGNNYDVQFTAGDLSITPRTLTIAANARGKSYGDVDPTLSFTHGLLANGDTEAVFSGALTRDAGENVGSYAIHQGTLSAGPNYLIDFSGNAFDISTGLLVINADARSKIYGNLDPSLTYTFSGLTNGDDASVISGALSRVAGENVGNYAIGQGTLDAGSNYTIQFNSSDLAITRRDLLVTADAQSRIYGSLDPSLTYAYSGLANGDTASVFTGHLVRSAGENVNSYAITQGSLAAGGNYALHYTGNTFSITPATLSVIANGQTKVYGDLDPTLTYSYTGLVNGDTDGVLTGDLVRAAGETVLGGPYALGLGTLSAGGNYVIDFTGNNLVITPKALVVDVASHLTKVYDGTTALPAGTDAYDISGLVGMDDVSVLGSVAFDNRNVGVHSISLSGMTLSGADASNYYLPITSATGSGEITARAITVSAQTDTKVYDGTTGSSLAALITNGSLATGDTADWTQAFDDRHAGAGKTLTASGVVDDGNGGSNYIVTFVDANGAIDRRAITVAAQSDSKVYDGSIASNVGPIITAGSLVGDDSGRWTQSFDSRNAGTGKSLIASGVIDDGNGGNNYDVTFVNNTNGTIDRRAITVSAQSDSKVYDGTVSSGVAPVLSGGTLVDGDSAQWSQSFADAVVGTGKTLSASGVIDDGNGGENYQITFIDNTDGAIIAANNGGNGGNGGNGNNGGNGGGDYNVVIPIIRDSNLTDLRNHDPSNPGSWLVGGDRGLAGGSGGLGNGESRGRFIRGDEAADGNKGQDGSDARSAKSRVASATQTCGGGSSNRGVRMPERPANFLKEEKDRTDASCSFFE